MKQHTASGILHQIARLGNMLSKSSCASEAFGAAAIIVATARFFG